LQRSLNNWLIFLHLDSVNLGLIPDLQNLDVGRSTNYLGISASFGNPMTGTLPLDLKNKQINTYNNTTYEYTPLYSVQSDVKIFITGSFLNTTGTEDSQLTIYFKEDGKTIATGFDDNGNNGNLNLIITVPNLSIKASSTYKLDFLYTENDNVSPSTARIDTGSYWTVTVDNLAAQSTYYLDPTVFTQQNFPGNINRFSEYNTLLNNVYSNRVSNTFYDVDYNGDILTPTNFSTIISESAIYAQVQDSNYALTSSWSELRYEGIKNTGTYNNSIAFASESLAPGYPIDYFTPYFAYFDSVEDANPEYPGGGKVNIIKLVNAETGQVLDLTKDNKNLDIVASIFKKGNLTYGVPVGEGYIGQSGFSNTVIEGGALYETILYKSGSNNSNEGFIANYTSSQPAYTASFALTSGPNLVDTGTANVGWIYSLNNNTSSLGVLDPVRSYGIPSGSNVGIYNKNTGEYVTASPYPFVQGALSSSISQQDTYLPLQPNDFIRFGYDPDSPYGVDEAFNTGILTQIKTITTGSDYDQFSALRILNLSFIPVAARQNYRIFRRVPNETFVLIQNLSYAGPGLLLPYNFNPKYNPIEVAKNLNLI